MKPMGKILDETTIESSVGLAETIEKLREQQGPCSDEDSCGIRKYFSCTKKGVVRFTDSSGNYGSDLYFVEGRVLEQDGKTVVKIYSLKSRTEKFDFWYKTIVAALFIIAIVVNAIITKQLFTEATAFLLATWFLLTATAASGMLRREKNKEYDLEVMQNEIIERVEAIKRWDE